MVACLRVKHVHYKHFCKININRLVIWYLLFVISREGVGFGGWDWGGFCFKNIIIFYYRFSFFLLLGFGGWGWSGICFKNIIIFLLPVFRSFLKIISPTWRLWQPIHKSYRVLATLVNVVPDGLFEKSHTFCRKV